MVDVENFVAPQNADDWLSAVRANEAEQVIQELNAFRVVIQRWLSAVTLPIDQLVLTLAQDVFTEASDLALAHKLALVLRGAADDHADWRLPELTAELAVIAKNERRFIGFSSDDSGFDPERHRGRVVVTTMHKAKGLEWDRVYLMSVNNYDFPSSMPNDRFISEKWFVRSGLDLTAEALAQLSALESRGEYDWPGEPLAQADAVWRFKRLARELAARHGFLASFAAKPFLDQPGTGMHWHLSLQHTDGRAWPHAFSPPSGEPVLEHFIAGLQTEAAAAMAFCAPFDMSYDRIRLSDAAPTHASWGEDSRSLAFRIPASSPAGRRVENRLPGGDANPYLILASMIGLGLDGLQAARLPGAGQALPTSLAAALDALQASATLRAQLGSPLLDAYIGIKRHESRERHGHPDPRQQWDLWHLIELA